MSRFTEAEYAFFVNAKARPAALILDGLDDHTVQLLHAALGVAGEAGEVVDVIKKATMYGTRLDRQKVIIELGDLEFYLQILRSELSITREQVIDQNLVKLDRRYADKFTQDEAVSRRDTQTPDD